MALFDISIAKSMESNTSMEKSARAVTNQCSGVGFEYCMDCKTAAYCNGGQALAVPCSDNQVCGSPSQAQTPGGELKAYNVACLPIDDGGPAECVCAAEDAGPKPDLYDSSAYFVCYPGGISIPRQCEDGKIFDDVSKGCITPPESPTCTGEMDSFPILPDCTSFVICVPDGNGDYTEILAQCENSEVYDEQQFMCVADISPPESPTDTDCEAIVDGAISHELECNSFYVCKDSTLETTPQCCPSGKLFDQNTQSCVASTNSITCPRLSMCASTPADYKNPCPEDSAVTAENDKTTETLPGTQTPPQAAECTIDGNIPFDGNCHKYYSCIEFPATSGIFLKNEVFCPGKLIFSPSEGCSLGSKIPECKSTSDLPSDCAICNN